MVGTVTVMVAVLVFYTVQALTLTDRSKYFAQGFSIGGWLYLLLLALGFEHTLATTWASQVCYGFVSAETQPNLTYHGAWYRGEGDQIRFSRQSDVGENSPGGETPTRRRQRGGYGGYGGYSGGGYGGYSGAGYGEATASGNRPFLTRYAR